MFIISNMVSSIYIHLCICMLVVLPSCYGEREFYFKEDGLKIKLIDWYRHLDTRDLNNYIQDVVYRIGNRTRGIDLSMKIGSLDHGQLIDSQLSEELYSVYLHAGIISEASSFIGREQCQGYYVTWGQCAIHLSKVKLDKTSMGEMCLSMYYNKTACIGMNLKYRSPDGSCNNLKRSFSGKATTAYKRLLFPYYKNDFDRVMDQSNWDITPNPRRLSVAFVRDEHSPDDFKTMAMAYWTIFVGHDLSHTAISIMMNRKKPVICCNENDNKYGPDDTNELCLPISIPNDDPFFFNRKRYFGNYCMNYVRSMPAVRSDCTFGPREQMNQATHYLDGSMIYGSSAKRTWSLRTNFDGQLLSSMCCDNKSQGDPLEPQYMPLEDTESNACQYGSGTCYRAGDTRANSLPQLTVMHTLWMREHNRLAKLLSHVNPHWDDERIFQEARKIVTASIQHITYAEWLPALLGENYTRQNGLELSKKGYSNAYNETTDPSVSNSFATAILPFANSMISDIISLYTENREINASLSLKQHYNRPTYLIMNYIDELVRGLSTQNTQKVDMLFTETLTNYLYTVHPENRFGMDIFSLDIQRTRDHGIPRYTKFRKYCGLKDIENMKDLSEIMVEGSTERLLKQYKHWIHIDLLVGALFEKHEEDSMVGPTMRCIIREQFIRTRIADRYFYDLPKVFNEDQLTEIRKVTLARVFCDNSNNITMMQKQVFLKPEMADLQLCNSQSIPKININHWSEMVDTFQK
ncbi:LOW QUALITY PROTEIN: peroxidase-like [Metopolophium dirhodum]|uniref:LOW QUALITY PROTEIN: peroxidase-like n=1 Tax=Metopolophium dirhodum TaxID=44670 RepID=UPI002990625A|nr:LOW QUALITY PROTEIN: peroxidase-like [Metopolophium dirhodum]